MKLFTWLKQRITHKLQGFSRDKIRKFLKENGLAFVVIFIAWEIIEDIIFPVIFAALGNYVHPAFYAGIPASLILCFHWLAIPILWGFWLKIKKKEVPAEFDCCGEDKDESNS